MKSSYSLIWTGEAKKGLIEILTYIRHKFSEKEVKQFSKKLHKSLEILRANPKVYPMSKSNPGARRIVIGRLTSLIYRIEHHSITIVTVYDNRMKPNNQS